MSSNVIAICLFIIRTGIRLRGYIFIFKLPNLLFKRLDFGNKFRLQRSFLSPWRAARRWKDDAIRNFSNTCDAVVFCYLGDDKLMVDGQKALIDACEECNVPSYVASDWALDYSKLNLGELFSKDPMIHVKAYLETKKVQGVHILIGGSMEPIFSPFFNIFDPSTDNFRYWGNGDELMEGTTDDNAAEFTAAVALDPKATGIVRCKVLPSTLTCFDFC